MPPKIDPEISTANLPAILDDVTAQVLATMFFDEAVTAECEHSWLLGATSVHIGFDGSHRGDFWLTVSGEVAQSIAPAFLGIDAEETSEAQRGQVLLELANILCGSILSHFWPDSDLTLEPPEVVGAEVRLEGGVHRCFMLSEGTLAVSIQVSSSME